MLNGRTFLPLPYPSPTEYDYPLERTLCSQNFALKFTPYLLGAYTLSNLPHSKHIFLTHKIRNFHSFA